MLPDMAVGDRWIYTTPGGRECPGTIVGIADAGDKTYARISYDNGGRDHTVDVRDLPRLPYFEREEAHA